MAHGNKTKTIAEKYYQNRTLKYLASTLLRFPFGYNIMFQSKAQESTYNTTLQSINQLELMIKGPHAVTANKIN